MTKLAYRAYNDGSNIVAVAFPEDGGGAVLRRAVPFSAVGLAQAGSAPAQHDMPFEVVGQNEIVNGGLHLEVDYEGERISLMPVSSRGSGPMESKRVTYTFDDFGVRDERESDIQKAKSKATIDIRPESLPLDDETWP